MKKEKKLNEEEEFEKYLEKIEDPEYEGETNFVLPEDATPLEKTKYEICQSILAYKQDNNLTTEQVARQIQLSIPETKEIFLARLDKFTLDRLMNYVSKIFSPCEVKLTIEKKQPAVYA